jgi:hypothetical protein
MIRPDRNQTKEPTEPPMLPLENTRGPTGSQGPLGPPGPPGEGPLLRPPPEAPPGRRKPDREIQLLARIDRLLATLEAGERRRIVLWLNSRYGSILQNAIDATREAR